MHLTVMVRHRAARSGYGGGGLRDVLYYAGSRVELPGTVISTSMFGCAVHPVAEPRAGRESVALIRSKLCCCAVEVLAEEAKLGYSWESIITLCLLRRKVVSVFAETIALVPVFFSHPTVPTRAALVY